MKMIVPLDGSNAGFKVIRHAVELAKLYGDELVLLNIQASLQQLGLQTIKRGGQLLQDQGVPFSAKIRVGIPAIEIVAESHASDVRLIVMAVGKGREEAIGSISEHVVKLAKCPVVLIPEMAT